MRAKGLEPIVGAILLIVISVIAAVLVYLWFTGFLTRSTSSTQAIYQTSKLQIVGATLSSTSSTTATATVYLQNVGSTTATITQVLVVDPATQDVVCTNATTFSATTILPGAAGTIHASLSSPSGSCKLTPGYTYVLEVVTQDGAIFTTQVAAS
ncbi:MAG: archaellin/type IV pilin N-terminal domain-containing protein [Thermoproteus sp. AZ2]|jgi:FlaG/FlaF family flagellin (archaellin)|uniref:Archaellin/type IV pilin N-terminal domain-containing protein n=1 Tax=Thermoproteus sp. AZ2 TaxID=1609232 RepID=A0ACC6UY85_9CREN